MRKRNVVREVMGVFGYAVSVLFVVLGFYLIFAASLDHIPEEMRTILGVVLVTYGIFRSVLTYQKQREARNEENE